MKLIDGSGECRGGEKAIQRAQVIQILADIYILNQMKAIGRFLAEG